MCEIDANSLHQKLLSMLMQFHEFCVEHNIKYYLIGGSALGARRHCGFIPWDDDVDVGMVRKEYEKLERLAEYLPDNLELTYYKNKNGSPMHYIKLVDKNTTLVERNYTNYVEGVYIDIFPLDEMCSSSWAEKIRLKAIRVVYGVLMAHYSTSEKQGSIKRIGQKIAKIIKGSFIHDTLEALMILRNGKKTDCLVNFLGAYGKKEMMPFNIFGVPQLYKFENTELYGPEKIDIYLQRLYGDYMSLPPEEERVFKHDYYYINLKLPYRNYSV